MKWVIAGLLAFFVYMWVQRVKSNVKLFLDNYQIVIVDKDEIEQDENTPEILSLKAPTYEHSIDLRGTPTHLCPCGSNIWNLKVMFEDYEIATYFLDMECVACGSVATAPTPVDREGME